MAVNEMNEEYLEYLDRLIENKRSLTPDASCSLLEHLGKLTEEVTSLHKPMSTKTSRIMMEAINELQRIIDKHKEQGE